MSYFTQYIDGLVQERNNPIDNALELRLSCTNSSIFFPDYVDDFRLEDSRERGGHVPNQRL